MLVKNYSEQIFRYFAPTSIYIERKLIMAKNTLFNKVWDLHKISTLPTGQDQIFIGLHIFHEVTSPQAFDMLRENGAKVAYPNRTFGTVDHIIPTDIDNRARPYKDPQAELMAQTIENNVNEFGIKYFGPETGKQGVIHIIFPELGISRPGLTIACGDSHTATHGAFGSLAFGMGTTEIRLVLETQTLPLTALKVRQIKVNGVLSKGVTAKDVILKIINLLGVKGGLGYAYEFAGSVIENMSMEERMTVCNMAIEGGARIGYINPDQTTYDYIKGREYAPKGEAFDKAVEEWKKTVSEPDAEYDDVVEIQAENIEPMVTWGVTPGQSVGITESTPEISALLPEEQKIAEDAYSYMKFNPGEAMLGKSVDVVFIGSCTNGRLSDLQEAAKILANRKVDQNTQVLIVPGSQQIKKQAEAEGLDQIFIAAGAEWRDAGCSMCLAMNPDKLVGDQISAATSNRNFKGRQGSPIGRTMLMSPIMAAATAIEGKVADPRNYF
jgi:3-isopropylmalate/(R)-2-methylmalate dehydratase large subunit